MKKLTRLFITTIIATTTFSTVLHAYGHRPIVHPASAIIAPLEQNAAYIMEE